MVLYSDLEFDINNRGRLTADRQIGPGLLRRCSNFVPKAENVPFYRYPDKFLALVPWIQIFDCFLDGEVPTILIERLNDVITIGVPSLPSSLNHASRPRTR